VLRVTLFDYGVGNIHSLATALARAGCDVAVEEDPHRIMDARALALPGVGAFPFVAARIAPVREALRRRMEAGLPVLAVCIGMQVLYEASEEGPGEGIGFFPGVVRRLRHRRLPHMGWNSVRLRPDPLFAGVAPGTPLYFVHSYAPSACPEYVIAQARYGGPFAAAVHARHVWATQFHPEKSGAAGRRIIENWVRLAEEHACS
jgi:glutamine amidotransferase